MPEIWPPVGTTDRRFPHLRSNIPILHRYVGRRIRTWVSPYEMGLSVVTSTRCPHCDEYATQEKIYIEEGYNGELLFEDVTIDCENDCREGGDYEEDYDDGA